MTASESRTTAHRVFLRIVRGLQVHERDRLDAGIRALQKGQFKDIAINYAAVYYGLPRK